MTPRVEALKAAHDRSEEFAPIEDAIAAIRAGEMVIVVDDEDRENEGNLTIAAEKITPEAINFMAKYGRGLICLAMTPERFDELEIPLMMSKNSSRHFSHSRIGQGETVKRQVPPDSEATATVSGLQQQLIKIGTDIRHLSHELHPALLQDAGLPAALCAYCEEFSKIREIPVSCEIDESVQELSPGAALCLYRIAQEALGNASKHSEAGKVEVRLTRSDGRVCLSVSDDGVGCDPNQIGKAGGLGLINMRERVLQLNGTFDFDSEPGRGATVKV